MIITYDKRLNSVFIYLVNKIEPGQSIKQEVISNNDGKYIIIERDKSGAVLGIEIMNSSPKQLIIEE